MVDVGYISNDRTNVSGSLASQSIDQLSASKTETGSVSAPRSVYDIEIITPYVKVDESANRAILEYRSNQTGEIVRQFPSKVQIKAFKEAEKIRISNELRASADAVAAKAEASTAPAPTSGAKPKADDLSTTFATESSVKLAAASASTATASYAAASNSGISIDTSGFGGSVQSANSVLV